MASPVARRMAEERGVELDELDGSGPGGRIIKADVEDAPSEGGTGERPARGGGDAGTAKGDVEIVELSRTQQVVARRMSESKATVPDFVLNAEVEMSAAVAARRELEAVAEEDVIVPSFNDFVVKASALALRSFPRANGAYRDGRWELYSRVNVGIAVATEGALVVPTLFDADAKALDEIARESRELAERVRGGKVTPPELSGGTFTVSNLGMYGITSFSAVINPPQAAILSVGTIREVPLVRDGDVVPGHTMALTLACDHRILYGAEAAEFLRAIVQRLEQPLALALGG